MRRQLLICTGGLLGLCAIGVSATLQITTTTLPAGRVGVAYNQTIAATGGNRPFTWSTSVGSPPAGLNLDATAGTLDALVDPAEWAAREVVTLPARQRDINAHGLGRELFGGMRRNVLSAEEGAITWLANPSDADA